MESGTEAGEWLVGACGRAPVETGLITTMGLAKREGETGKTDTWCRVGGGSVYLAVSAVVLVLEGYIPVVGVVVLVFGCVSSCRMELMKVVGEKGVSTGVASHTSTSGLGGSCLTLANWFSLERKEKKKKRVIGADNQSAAATRGTI